MNDYNTYGKQDIQLVLVHGGPGARGSMKDLALMLADDIGVLEVNQTKYTIDALIEDMKDYIDTLCNQPVVLLGHSWGAWLICLYAAKYPENIKQLVLVGSGSFTSDYVRAFNNTRMSRLSPKDKKRFDSLMEAFHSEDLSTKNDVMKEFGELMGKLDTYAYLDNVHASVGQSDFEMFHAIWGEASALRNSNQLLQTAKTLSVPMHIIQGDYDSHDIRGILEPFHKANIECAHSLLEKCGHYPWREKHARDAFLDIIRSITLR